MRPQANKPIIGENLLYFLVWAMALLVPILNSKMMSEEHVYLSNILLVWSKLLPYIIIFVINNSLLAPRLFFQHRYLAYIGIAIVMLTAIFYPLELYQDELRMMEYPDGTNYYIHGRASFTDLAWYWNVLLGLFLMGANCSIKFIFRSIQDEQRMVAMERHALQAEMDYLKYQINPHFFMNTLNNIHAMIDFDGEMAKQNVMELSHMLRHMLYDSSEQYTTLDKEVEFLNSYIKLMKIRYIDEVSIEFNTPKMSTCRRVKLPPLLFIVLVENAFKHGISYNHKSFIKISIAVDNDVLTCVVANSRHKQEAKQTERSGIGLNNITKRLDILFANTYTLTIDDTENNSYIVELVIPITNK